MIDPLRYYKEAAPTCEVERPVFCTIGDKHEDGAFYCAGCNADAHKYGRNDQHVRQTIVVGPGVRKNVLVRGDGVNFPLPLDTVTIKMKARVYQNGQLLHKIRKSTMTYIAGMSGKCVHVQILGARKLKPGDVTGSSDPFVVYSYCGRPVTSTRVKPHTLNPRWHNETFVVPMEEQMAYPRNMVHSQKDLIKFEVFDHDWVTSNDFLGHVELTRSKLMKLAVFSNEKPIRLPLTTKEYHGIVSLQFACDKNFLYIRLVSAEDLDKQDLLTYASPYAKFYLGEKELVATSSVVYNQLHPVWPSGNEFKIKIKSLLETEQLLDAQIRLHKASVGISSNRRERKIVSAVSDQFDQHNALPEFLALLRVELYDRRRWRGDSLLGKASIHVEYLRSILPDLTTFNEYTMMQDQSMHVSQSAAANSRSLSRYLFKGLSFHHNSPKADFTYDFTPQASRSSSMWRSFVAFCGALFACSWLATKYHSPQGSDVENSQHDRG
eukprot:gene26289-31756_t